MEDTVTLARQEREKQGPWEVEISHGGEADLHKHPTGCNKNPDHQDFIPVDQIIVEYLPHDFRDNEVVDLVRAMSDLTVLVSVKYVNDSRPETVPGSDKPFPFYKYRCRDMMRTGTGWVSSVDIYPDKYDNSYTTCKCKECVNSPTPKTQFAHIYINTAAHVVYDDLEAAHTTCDLFFDKGESPGVCSGVVTLSGLSFVRCDLDRDSCYMRYITQDLDLAYKLNKTITHYKLLSKSIGHKDNLDLSTEPHLAWEQQLQRYTSNSDTRDYILTIIVCHPHGCSKQVSFGRCLEKRQDGQTKYTYTTPTCPGSSGAHVCVLGKEGILNAHGGYVHNGEFQIDEIESSFYRYSPIMSSIEDSDTEVFTATVENNRNQDLEKRRKGSNKEPKQSRQAFYV